MAGMYGSMGEDEKTRLLVENLRNQSNMGRNPSDADLAFMQEQSPRAANTAGSQMQRPVSDEDLVYLQNASPNFGTQKDLQASLSDSNYNPDGTFLSRALGFTKEPITNDFYENNKGMDLSANVTDKDLADMQDNLPRNKDFFKVGLENIKNNKAAMLDKLKVLTEEELESLMRNL